MSPKEKNKVSVTPMEAQTIAKESAFVVIAKRNPTGKDNARSKGSVAFDLGKVSGRELTNPPEKPLVRVAKKLEVALDANSEYHRRFMAGTHTHTHTHLSGIHHQQFFSKGSSKE